ncbi:MAG: BrnT family toxin [Desulfovibrio sp.]|nr:BrnT family toxin [Desulfovibrio sp.]
MSRELDEKSGSLFPFEGNGEERWQAFGKVLSVYVVIVIHTYRAHDGEEFIRIISARRTTAH